MQMIKETEPTLRIIQRTAMTQAVEAALESCTAILTSKKNPNAQEDKAPRVVLGPRLVKALNFAVEKHANQARQGTDIPYLTHLIAVSAIVGESGGSEDEMIAALLHDAVENGGGAPVQGAILSRFGSAVAEIVSFCTDDDLGDEKIPWLERKQSFLERLAIATLPALRVICADKLHNAQCIAADLRDIGPSVFERFKADREGTLWYYRSLARIYSALLQDEPSLDSGFRTMIRELRETVGKMEG
jgi:(p)ppGpp synthase/HD superfamily hydrolase